MEDTLRWGGVTSLCSPARQDHESGLPSHLSRCQKELGILFVFPAPSHSHTHPGQAFLLGPYTVTAGSQSPPIHGHWAFPGHCPNGCLVICLKNRSWHTTPWLNPALAPPNLFKFLSIIKILPILSGLLIHPKAHSLTLNLRTPPLQASFTLFSLPGMPLSPKSSSRT